MSCSHVYSHHTVGAVYYTVGVVRTVKGDMANAPK